MHSTPFFTKLQARGLIHIEGTDRHDFLQGLISNDIHKLSAGHLLYACLLTPQGKFLHDFFIQEGDGFLLLDCEGGARARDLYQRLGTYRLRTDVRLSIEEDNPVYAVFGLKEGLPDPRHPDMDFRSFEKPDMEEKPFAEWDRRRITLGIPDGSRDMEVERSTLLECRIDKLNGIDWNKGCYMGQELTARTHHRGLCKKHLVPVKLNAPAQPPFTDIEICGKIVGNMRSSCGDIGLALLKDEHIKNMKENKNGNLIPL